jgi:hypothetical protein
MHGADVTLTGFSKSLYLDLKMVLSFLNVMTRHWLINIQF